MAPKRQRNVAITKDGANKRTTRAETAAASADDQEQQQQQQHATTAAAQNEDAPGQQFDINIPLPSPPPLLEPRLPEPLSNAAITTAQNDRTHLNPKTWDDLRQQFNADDNLATVASRRGLLVRFHISSGVRASSSSVPPLIVEAPEFADVAYLKRRVVKAKLIHQNTLLLSNRFDLKPTSGDNSTPLDNNALLFDVGYKAGEMHDLGITSRHDTASDMDQKLQKQTLKITEAGFGPKHDNPFINAYQKLTEGSDRQRAAAAAGPARRAGGRPIIAPPTEMFDGNESAMASPSAAIHGAAGASVAGGADGQQRQQPGMPPQGYSSPRNQRAGRWRPEEVQALVTGVQALGGAQWKEMHKAFNGKGIDASRTPVDYKDKWRNLVKAAQNPNHASRTAVLSEDMRTLILRLAAQQQTNQPVAGLNAVVSPAAAGIVLGTEQQHAEAAQQQHDQQHYLLQAQLQANAAAAAGMEQGGTVAMQHIDLLQQQQQQQQLQQMYPQMEQQ